MAWYFEEVQTRISYVVRMQPKQDFNFACPSCDAKLLVVRIPSPFRQGERATCPYCMDSLQPRDAGDSIQYRLVRGPSPPAEFQPKRCPWYGAN
jgi:predicted RNA-binding Zn-ribbon protein involved in translation (DUF1610 family)